MIQDVSTAPMGCTQVWKVNEMEPISVRLNANNSWTAWTQKDPDYDARRQWRTQKIFMGGVSFSGIG